MISRKKGLGCDTGFSLGSAPASGGGTLATTPTEVQVTYGYSQTDGRLLTVADAVARRANRG
ncbi:MAG: hypothetical protein WED15_05575 [Akkermansiaceae bacterium]